MIRLCRLAGKNHPQDWLEFYDSHTAYEWHLQRAANIVEPFGEDRADDRSRIHALFTKINDPEWLRKLFDLLSNYTGDIEPQNSGELEANPQALAKIKEQL